MSHKYIPDLRYRTTLNRESGRFCSWIVKRCLQTIFSKITSFWHLGGKGVSHMTFCLPTKCQYRQHCLAPDFRRKQFTIIQQLSMSSSSSGITADTRVVASQKQRWSPTDKYQKRCDVMGGSNLMSQWCSFGKYSLETPPKWLPLVHAVNHSSDNFWEVMMTVECVYC